MGQASDWVKKSRKRGVGAKYTKRNATTLSFVLTDQDAFGKQENLQARCLEIGLVLSFFFVCENTIMTEGSNCCLCKNMEREDCKIHSARIPEMRFVLDLYHQIIALFSTRWTMFSQREEMIETRLRSAGPRSSLLNVLKSMPCF